MQAPRRFRVRRSGLPRGTAESCQALALYALLTVFYTGANVERVTSELAADLGDPLLNLYVLNWTGEHASQWFGELWSAPFFFPSSGSIARSDHLLGPALVARGLRFLGADDRLAYNLLFLSSFLLSAWAMQWVSQRCGASLHASAIAGVVFAFLPFRWSHVSHLQILLSAPVPVTIYLFDRLLRRPDRRSAALFLLSYLTLLSCGLYLAYMTHLFLGGLAACHLFRSRDHGGRDERLVLSATAMACGVIALLVFGPYLYWSEQLGTGHSLGEALRYSPTIASFVSVELRLSTFYPEVLGAAFRPEGALFPGVAALVLAGFGVWTCAGGPEPRPPGGGREARALRLAGLLCLVLALAALVSSDLKLHEILGSPAGEVRHETFGKRFLLFLLGILGWLGLEQRRTGRWPLLSRFPDIRDRWFLIIGISSALACLPIVWATFSPVVPGMSGMRAFGRFFTFTAMAVAFFAARGLDHLLVSFRHRAAGWLLAAALAVLLVVESRPTLLWAPLEALSSTPAALTTLGETERVSALAHFPAWGDARETRYMYWSLAHGLPIANGYSGTIPDFKRRWSAPLPDRTALESLEDHGISHVAVHGQDNIRRMRRRNRRLEGRGRQHLLAVVEEPGLAVYRICAPSLPISSPARICHSDSARPILPLAHRDRQRE